MPPSHRIMLNGPREGETWRHSKTDTLYRIVAVALDEATKEQVVVYTVADPDRPSTVWVRPLSSWMANVPVHHPGDWRYMPRFARETS